MRVPVTGANGFIGSHLLPELTARQEVIALTRSGPPPEAEPLVDWVVQDLAEPLMERKLPARIDAVVHLAQSARYKEFPDGAADVYAVNVHSTFQLLEWAR